MKRILVILGVLTLVCAFSTAFAAPRVQPSNPGPASDPAVVTTSAATPGVMRTAGATDIENLNTATFYPTIAAALADPNTLDGHVLEVQVPSHAEGIVAVDKSVTIQGQTGTEVVVPTTNTTTSGDGRGWFLVSAPNVTVQNLNFDGTGYLIWQGFRVLPTAGGATFSHCDFTQIRYQASGSPYAGNAVVFIDCNGTVSDCALSEIGRHGIFFFGTGCTNGVMERCAYTGKGAGDWLDYGCEIGGGAVVSLTDNTVTDCIGVASSDSSTSAGVIITTYFGAGTSGSFTGNALTGNSVGLFAGYDNTDVSVVTAGDNDFSGNADYGVVNTSATVTDDASANWWGSNDAITVASSVSGQVDYTPWLDSGTDTDGAAGFQGDFSVLDVDDDSPQTGASSRIQEGVDLVTASTVNVMPGTYAGGIVINKQVNLLGAQSGVDARTTRGSESVIQDTVGLIQLVGGCAGSVIDGFTFSGGGSRALESTSGPINYVQILNNRFSGLAGGASAMFLNDSGIDMDISRNKIDGASVAGTLIFFDTDSFRGIHITDNELRNSASYGIFCDGNNNMGVSATPRTPLIDGNLVDNCDAGANLGTRGFRGGTISNNTFSNCAYDGIQAGIQESSISDNTFSGNARYGLALTSFGNTNPARGAWDDQITGNTFSGNAGAGLLLSSTQAPGTISTNTINGNDFVGNVVGLTYGGTETIDATCNWWGDIGGPDAPPTSPNPPGDPLTGSTVQFAPWLDGSISGSPNCDQYGSDYVSANPTPDCLTPSNTCKTVPIDFTRTDATGARGVSVTFELSPELELCVDENTSIHQGTWLSGYGTAFQVYANGGGSYTVDQSILGLPCGVTTGGQLFTIDVKASGSAAPEDEGTITITQVTVRDCSNAPIPGIAGPPATIDIDNNVPSAVTGLAASQVKTGNDADGTTKIDLAWTALASPGADMIEIYRAPYGAYPEYDDDGGSVPAAPGYPPAGPWSLAGTVAASATSYTDETTARDFWYYVAFVVDGCGNVSGVSNETGGTLNYHLGDVSDGVTAGDGDNQVDLLDISLLGSNYGIALSSPTDPLGYLDVGPTTDYSVDARPTTDNQIQFEDLIMFAINYGQVSKPGTRPLGTDPNAVTLEVPENPGGTFGVKIEASSDGRIQGLTVPLTWNGDVVEPVGFTEGDLPGRQGGRVLVLSPKVGTVDAAVFGSTFRGSGELAEVQFRRIATGDPGIGLGDVEARDGGNRKVELGTTATKPGVTLITRLLPSAPNPFRAATGIRFALKETGPVQVKVYGLDGRLVRTLVDETLPSGERTVQWDGRDEAGREVASGSYVIRFVTRHASQTERVVRLR